jgi:hypothetical protein
MAKRARSHTEVTGLQPILDVEALRVVKKMVIGVISTKKGKPKHCSFTFLIKRPKKL